jgi:hypothetical protein
VRALEEQLLKDLEFHGIVGKGPAMLEVFDFARKVARHYTNVLPAGPTGTGKELVARAIHQISPVSQQKLAVCNCSAVVDSLLESQLFGHVRGAFTGGRGHAAGIVRVCQRGNDVPGRSRRARKADDVVCCESPFRQLKMRKLAARRSHKTKERKKMRTKSLAGVLIALLLMSGATAASAQEVTQTEKDKALQYLETTKKNVLEATKGLSEAQWNFKPAPDRWSVAQVMEHIAAAEDFIRGLVKEKVMMSPAGEPGRDVKKTDEAVLAMVPDRTNKIQAPEPLVPTNRFGSPDGSIKHFVESRATTEDFLKTTTGMRDHVADSPLGKLDGYEFVLLIAAHSERHTKQINEVKADPDFPKK